jgi:hypothetical protein
MKCGYVALLPKNREGRRVLCCDASRLPKDDAQSRLRCLFYMLHVTTGDLASNTNLSIILIMNKLSFERMKGDMSLADMLSIYPVKIAAIHLIRQPARLGVGYFEEKVVPMMKLLFQKLDVPLHIHSGTQTCDLRQDLATHGFDMNNLPRSIGGGWTYENFLEWRNQQLISEGNIQRQMSSVSTTRNLPEPNVTTTVSFTPSISSMSQNTVWPIGSTSDLVMLPPHFHTDRLGFDSGIDQHQLLQLQRSLDVHQVLQQNPGYDPQHWLNQLQLPSSQPRIDQQLLFPSYQRTPLAFDCDNPKIEKSRVDASLVALLNASNTTPKLNM